MFPAGSTIRVVLGTGSEVVLPAAEVMQVFPSWEQAYRYRREQLSGHGVEGRLELAQWCLHHRLWARCADQLLVIWNTDPHNRLAERIEQQLRQQCRAAGAVAVDLVDGARPNQTELESGAAPPAAALTAFAPAEAPMPVSPPSTLSPAPTVPEVSSDAAPSEQFAMTVTPEQFAQFSSQIQPLLLNRCGNNACHGASAGGGFQLLRPMRGRALSKQITAKNLHAVLGHVNHAQPAESPLLTYAARPHGQTLRTAYDAQTTLHAERLAAWVRSIGATPASPTNDLVSPARSDAANEPASGEAVRSDSASTRGDAATADPFDPAVFNQRFHAAASPAAN